MEADTGSQLLSCAWSGHSAGAVQGPCLPQVSQAACCSRREELGTTAQAWKSGWSPLAFLRPTMEPSAGQHRVSPRGCFASCYLGCLLLQQCSQLPAPPVSQLSFCFPILSFHAKKVRI